MKIVFITNYAIFHQTSVWDNFVKQDQTMDFTYLATAKIDNDRKQMHYNEIQREYIKYSNDLSNIDLNKLFSDVDLVIYGGSEDTRVDALLKDIKKVIIFTEHMRKKHTLRKCLAIFKQTYIYKKIFPNSEKYLLAPSYYTYKEFSFAKLTSKDRIYKYGYFPETTITACNKEKKIVWSGRLLKWKHPEIAPYFLKQVNQYDKEYFLNIYGKGKQKEKLINCIKKFNLTTKTNISGFVPNEELINIFSKSEIGLFTSDIGEGWGVVLNEMLSKGCVVFANELAGSTRFLIKDKINGFTYKNKKELKAKIRFYFSLSKKEKENILNNAQETIRKLWNSSITGQRLYEISKAIILNNEIPVYNEGPLSKF